MEISRQVGKISTLVITGARQEFKEFIFESLPDLLPAGEGFFFIQQRGADEALAHADRLMPCQDQFLVRDILRTQALRARWGEGARRCLLMGCVSCPRDADGFQECVQFVRRELYEVDRWHIFDDIKVACLTPTPEIILLN